MHQKMKSNKMFKSMIYVLKNTIIFLGGKGCHRLHSITGGSGEVYGVNEWSLGPVADLVYFGPFVRQ